MLNWSRDQFNRHLKSFLSKLSVAGLDLRALAVFRIILGLNIVYNVLHYRLFDVPQFYSHETGIVPNQILYSVWRSI